MDWVKLATNYYLDPAIMRAGEAAETLFTRALAYVGDHETDGVVPREALRILVARGGTARARALVREGLWEVIPEGWRFVQWTKHQASRDQMAARRESGRARQARHRGRNAVSNAVTDGVSNASVTPTEVEGEVDAAAAAAREASTQPLPPAVEILRGALEAHTLRVRWDTLTADELAEVERLAALHGDAALVRSAISSFQPAKPPATAKAWLGQWRDLRAPGDLALVSDPCPEPGHSGTTRHCAQCASERKAAK